MYYHTGVHGPGTTPPPAQSQPSPRLDLVISDIYNRLAKLDVLDQINTKLIDMDSKLGRMYQSIDNIKRELSIHSEKN